jgi:DNA helicase-2/ATP-dependent DNA helicase PcrA
MQESVHSKEDIGLETLNPQQKEAVLSTDGPLLVLAGAGTGKTKVLTSRIGHIVSAGLAYPSQLLVVTFTNKAATEMKSRTSIQLSHGLDGMWIGTFHSIAAKILRRHAELLELSSEFTIIDHDDQVRLIKQIIKDMGQDDKDCEPKIILQKISRFKDKAWLPHQVPNSEVGLYARGKLIEIYVEYHKRLLNLNAVDFGDLTLYNIELFNQHSSVLRQYQTKFKYILVDEYQDTNVAQYLWLRMLAQLHHNICCVGDDDQSIYGWRGAEITNILRFDKDFLNAKIIRLEKNYRSTNHILNAATFLIDHNKHRHGKTLWTEGEEGNKIKVLSVYDDKQEARFVATEIMALRHRDIQYQNIAVLIRAGHQSRVFEEAFNRLHVPYKIIGGLKFYERTEVRDVMAYIRILVNPNDALAFERIVNVPRRSIGKSTLDKIITTAKTNNIHYYEAANQLMLIGIIKGKTKAALTELFDTLEHHRKMLATRSHSPAYIMESLLNAIAYNQAWDAEDDAKERIDNIKELLRSLQEYESLSSYLEHVSLITDSDNTREEECVSIMTIHASKGLEFDTVFLVGWEEGVFPSQKSLEQKSHQALEEERRLAYVAITRARRNLYISCAEQRRLYGGTNASYPSRFLSELPAESVERIFAPYLGMH